MNNPKLILKTLYGNKFDWIKNPSLMEAVTIATNGTGDSVKFLIQHKEKGNITVRHIDAFIANPDLLKSGKIKVFIPKEELFTVRKVGDIYNVDPMNLYCKVRQYRNLFGKYLQGIPTIEMEIYKHNYNYYIYNIKLFKCTEKERMLLELQKNPIPYGERVQGVTIAQLKQKTTSTVLNRRGNSALRSNIMSISTYRKSVLTTVTSVTQ